MPIRKISVWLVCAAAAPTTAQPVQTAVRLKMWNSSEHTIQEAYVSPVSQSRWGRNLVTHSVKPGEKLSLIVPGGCGSYDLRFVAPEGIEYIREDVRLCEQDAVVRIAKRALRKMTEAQAAALDGGSK